jgi:hypothetical protein
MYHGIYHAILWWRERERERHDSFKERDMIHSKEVLKEKSQF